MKGIRQVAKTALQTVATKSTPRSSLFMFDMGRSDTCVAIDLILNAQPSVTPYVLAAGERSSKWADFMRPSDSRAADGGFWSDRGCLQMTFWPRAIGFEVHRGPILLASGVAVTACR